MGSPAFSPGQESRSPARANAGHGPRQEDIPPIEAQAQPR